MSIKINIPEQETTQLKPRISVIGVGGGGGNAVNNMVEQKLEGVDFIVANTDAQALTYAKTDARIQLGIETTKGLGAGARPEIGQQAAEETSEEIEKSLEGSNMVFITAGMGGGTGSGAAPVIAKMAKEKGILTVGVVTKPFQFEGKKRQQIAEAAVEEFGRNVDTIIIIPNQNLFRIADKNTTLVDAFKMADDVLYSGVRSVTDLMMMPGLINLDFADVKTIMQDMGKAIMGTGEAEGDNRAIKAAELAISNPLLDDNTMKGAKGLLINITGGNDLTLFEVDEAASRIREEVDDDANIIFGSSFDEELSGKIRVSVVATGVGAKFDDKNNITETIKRTQDIIRNNPYDVINIDKKEEAFETLSKTQTDKLEKFTAIKPQEEIIEKANEAPKSFIETKVEEKINELNVKEETNNIEQTEEDIVKTKSNLFETPKENFFTPRFEEPKEEKIKETFKEDSIETELEEAPKSNTIPEMPHASSLFSSTMSIAKANNKNVENEFKDVLSNNSNSFESASKPVSINKEPELFAKSNFEFKEVEETKTEEFIEEEESYTPTLIERVTGLSIARRNRKKTQESHNNNLSSQTRENNDNNFVTNDEEDEPSLDLDIPSFLRRPSN
jgi:cell division protein FtsZ